MVSKEPNKPIACEENTLLFTVANSAEAPVNKQDSKSLKIHLVLLLDWQQMISSTAMKQKGYIAIKQHQPAPKLMHLPSKVNHAIEMEPFHPNPSFAKILPDAFRSIREVSFNDVPYNVIQSKKMPVRFSAAQYAHLFISMVRDYA